MVKVKKVYGQLEGKVWIEGEIVSFDAEGNAEVSEAVAQYLKVNQFPDYEIEGEASEEEVVEEADEADEAEEVEASEAPKKPTPRKAPAKPRN